MRIWDTTTWRYCSAHVRMPVTALAIAPDGTWLVTGHDDGTVRTWDTASGQPCATLTAHTKRVTAMAIAPDGTWLATGHDDGTVRTWDTAATGQPRATLTGHTKRVTAMAIAPDGTWLATHGLDGTVRTWDASWRQSGAFNGHAAR